MVPRYNKRAPRGLGWVHPATLSTDTDAYPGTVRSEPLSERWRETPVRRLVLLEGEQGLAESAAAWTALERRTNASYFQSYPFARTWFDAIGRPNHARPLVVVLYHGETPVGLFPATTVRLHGFPVLSWIGVPDAQDRGDILFDTLEDPNGADEFVAEALRMLRARVPLHAPLFLNVPLDGVAAPAFDRMLLRIPRGVMPVIDTSGTFEEYHASLSRRRRSRMAKAEERLASLADATVESTPVDTEVGSKRLAQVFEIKARQRAAAGRPATFSDVNQLAFCQNQCGGDVSGTVTVLLLQGVVAAGVFTVTHNTELVGVMTAYDAEYAALTPGLLLQWLTLRKCFEGPITEFNLGWGCEAYKVHWRPRLIHLSMYVGKGVVGRALAFAVHALDRHAARRDPAEATRRGLCVADASASSSD